LLCLCVVLCGCVVVVDGCGVMEHERVCLRPRFVKTEAAFHWRTVGSTI
jgi:hypothetical protein